MLCNRGDRRKLIAASICGYILVAAIGAPPRTIGRSHARTESTGPAGGHPRKGRGRPAAVVRRRRLPRTTRPTCSPSASWPTCVRERKNGNFAYYNVNTHLNPTNVCVYRCTFCAFRADLKSPKGYVMSDEQILERAAEAERRGATELHIVGGLHHQLPFEWYLNVVRIIHQAHPRLHLKAYTAVEWDWFARLTGRPTRDLLAEFKEAGLGSLPGGGAEIFHPEVRDKICEHKADAERWLRIHRDGPRAGPALQRHHALRPHREARHRIDHLFRLRELQDETGGFQTFIPLAFHPDNTRLDAHPQADAA